MKNKINDRPQTEPVYGFSNKQNERVVLPLPPVGEDTRFEMAVYARFMKHLREVPNSRLEIKILAAIQFAADMAESNDALVAKVLVDCGLRAPRKAFPAAFLDFADRSLIRGGWEQGTVPVAVLHIHDHWSKIGEDRFVHMQTDHYAVQNENNFLTT